VLDTTLQLADDPQPLRVWREPTARSRRPDYDRSVSGGVEVIEPREEIALLYRRFALYEAAGRSPLYEQFALRVAADEELRGLIAGLPRPKWQPNLLLGAVRYLFGTLANDEEFARVFSDHTSQILAVVRARSTQTNEPARCATLMPVLAQLPQPLALLEVGAAAGLCLYPDRYAYEFNGSRVGPQQLEDPPPPLFELHATTGTPLPAEPVDICWRAGLDLSPIDASNTDSVAWLEALIWPGEEYRLPHLRAALAIARRDPPLLVHGDLRNDLPALAARAPAAGTLVIFHTAVLNYVRNQRQRAAFARTVENLNASWIANEGAGIVDPAHERLEARQPGAFLLCLNGTPTAWTDPHGLWIDWYPP
jgi:hypothetical protein